MATGEPMATITKTEPTTFAPAVTGTRLLTADEFLTLPDAGRFELVDGQLVERTVRVLSSLVAFELGGRIREHCKVHLPAWIIGSDCGCRCFPGSPSKVRRPDVAMVRRERLTAEQIGEGLLKIAPDLVVEVISPNDLAEEVETKVQEYRVAGVRLIWVVDPATRTAYITRRDGTGRPVPADCELDGEDVLPGFRCRLADLFEGLPQPLPAASVSSE